MSLTEQHAEQLTTLGEERVSHYVEEKDAYGLIVDDLTSGTAPKLWIYDHSGGEWSAVRMGNCILGGRIKLEAVGRYFYCGIISEDSQNDQVNVAGQAATLVMLENGSKVWFAASDQNVEM